MRCSANYHGRIKVWTVCNIYFELKYNFTDSTVYLLQKRVTHMKALKLLLIYRVKKFQFEGDPSNLFPLMDRTLLIDLDLYLSLRLTCYSMWTNKILLLVVYYSLTCKDILTKWFFFFKIDNNSFVILTLTWTRPKLSFFKRIKSKQDNVCQQKLFFQVSIK